MSILNYFEEYFKGNPLDDENIRKLLEENPEEFYHQGSEMFKQQIFEEKILKIMKLIFVQMYQIDEVKEFFLREILGGSTDFWSDVFEILIQKNVIGSDCNPNKLAEMYFAKLSNCEGFSDNFSPCIAAIRRHLDEAASRIARLG